MKEKILVFCAHADDEIIGAGGTIAKYTSEGNNVLVVIFSKGEKSIPWLREEIVAEKRKKESELIDSILSCKVKFLDLPDLGIVTRIKERGFNERVKNIIRKFKPNKVFTHSLYDAHPDHQAVFHSVIGALQELREKPKLFTFSVWGTNPKNISKLYIDISSTFKHKLKALKAFKSQKLFTFVLLLPIIIKARIAGLKNKCKYAEVFYVENYIETTH